MLLQNLGVIVVHAIKLLYLKLEISVACVCLRNLVHQLYNSKQLIEARFHFCRTDRHALELVMLVQINNYLPNNFGAWIPAIFSHQ